MMSSSNGRLTIVIDIALLLDDVFFQRTSHDVYRYCSFVG